MKRISYLLKACMNRLASPFTVSKPIVTKINASESEKECLNCSKKKDSKTPASDKQRVLLHQFMHFYSDN
jgi:hypothetical protein